MTDRATKLQVAPRTWRDGARRGNLAGHIRSVIAYQLQAAARVRRVADNEPDRERANRLRAIAADLRSKPKL
jgi:hypothetical protein